MKPILLILLIIGVIYYDYWEDIHDRDDWEQLQLYSIVLKGNSWQSLNIQLPPKVDTGYRVTEYKIAIPHRYQLKRKQYIIDIEVNPNDHSWPINLQMTTLRKPDLQALKVASSWLGNCGKTGAWEPEAKRFSSWGSGYFTKPKAIGFLWYPGTGYCTEGIPETAEHASSFPIQLKIFDGSDLIGEEQIDFEIFENGIMKYIVMP